jgi:chromate transport protein ChrA
MGVYIALLTATALLLIAAAALLPRRRFQNRPGIVLGWIGQVVILALGIVSPGLVFVALVFGTMWGVGVYWGRRIDREAAAREA